MVEDKLVSIGTHDFGSSKEEACLCAKNGFKEEQDCSSQRSKWFQKEDRIAGLTDHKPAQCKYIGVLSKNESQIKSANQVQTSETTLKQPESSINGSFSTLAARLNSYKHLDDYELYREERLKLNAEKRFGLIMQSIKTKFKDCSKLALAGEETDSDMNEEPSELSSFNQILRRHKKRFKQNLNLHHR